MENPFYVIDTNLENRDSGQGPRCAILREVSGGYQIIFDDQTPETGKLKCFVLYSDGTWFEQ